MQHQAVRFHDNHGEKVVLSNDQQTAEYLGGPVDCGGIVISRDPMEVNTLYEVEIAKSNEPKWRSFVLGVMTSPPDSVSVPDNTWGWKNAVYSQSSGFSDHGIRIDSSIAQAVDDLPAHSRVGVSVDGSRRLHIHVNGDDQGVVPCRSLPDPCWAMWQLDSEYRKIKSLPVTDLS